VNLGPVINRSFNDGWSSLSFDGRTLYFSGPQDTDLTLDIYMSTRTRLRDYGDWSEPTNLGAAVNSAFADQAPEVSRKERSLYFESNRPGLGGFDIYVSQRSRRRDDWGPAVPLGPPVNTAFNEQGAALSRDGHYLFFASDRPGGLGGFDVWVSYRDRVNDDFGWEAPVPITPINAPGANEGAPAYFENRGGRPQLFFMSTRSGGAGGADFYVSEQQDDGTWGSPTPVSELNSAAFDQGLTIRRDGLEVFFHSFRPGSEGSDLWTSTRASVSHPWSEPINLGPTINTSAAEMFPGLSPKGKSLYFNSNRPGSIGTDIWVITRERDDDDDEDDDDSED
jgi:Tol biopolymer transport system component